MRTASLPAVRITSELKLQLEGDRVHATYYLEHALRRFSPGGALQKRAQAELLELTFPFFAAAGIAPEDAHKQSQILLASKVTSTNSVSGLSKAWKRIRASVDEKLGYEAAHFTMHDIRRTVATGLQRIGIPLVVSEAVLNHQSGSAMAGVAGVYHRHQYTNEKREALALWGREVQLLVAKYPPQDSQEE